MINKVSKIGDGKIMINDYDVSIVKQILKLQFKIISNLYKL